MTSTARAAGAYIDDDENDDLNWTPYNDEDGSDEEEEDSLEEFDDLRVEDEDWEIAERDFTKHYNRLKQHVAVRTGTASGSSASMNKSTTVAALPAVNSPALHSTSTPANSQTIRHAKDKASDQLAALSKYSSRISQIDAPYALVGGVGVNRKGPSAHANMKDKSDRATNEQVLDPRTRLILFKMIGREVLEEINGCVSTGKEANVYHAIAGPLLEWPSKPISQPHVRDPSTPTHVAIKIYKTSILVFKDRTRYVEGEHRFRRGTNTSNPRKMVRLWAEKELRNLKRLASAGIPCPIPIEVRENVLIMEFVGDAEGWASPRLKDAILPDSLSDLTQLYTRLVLMMRKMYQQCKLVHADLSEYNILYHDAGQLEQRPFLVIIDVSQSVESAHPHAWDFLRNDVKNVEEFWARRGVTTLGLRGTFEFVIREDLGNEISDEAALEAWLTEPPTFMATEAASSASEEGGLNDDEVFMKSHMPRSLAEMRDPEKVIEKQKREEKERDAESDNDEVEQQETDDDDDSEEDTEEEEDSDKKFDRTPRGHRHEDKDAKKERKKAVKAENKERRKQKMPKAEKKKSIKKSKAGR